LDITTIYIQVTFNTRKDVAAVWKTNVQMLCSRKCTIQLGFTRSVFRGLVFLWQV